MSFLSELGAALQPQLPLAFAWLAYAAFHSLTASLACKNWVKRRWPIFFARYRLIYTAVAALLLTPLALLSVQTPGPVLWEWRGLTAWMMNGAAIIGVAFFLRSGSGYDLPAFLGWRAETATQQPRLVISDCHRFVRHPWYSIALLVIWTRDMSAANFVSALAITLYFVLGSRLEERKLVVEFGERYRQYQRRVPRLVPLPWRFLTRAEAARLAG